jgi:tRNA pseudouridine38-40 synthase
VTARLVLEYDGGGFAGWARQPGLRTVQEEVERTLGVLLRAPPEGFVPVTVAGRTDTGVHALGQVCSYDGEVLPVRALNGLLPPDVAVLSCSAAADGFDARRDATSRAYCYRILTRRARPAVDAGRVLWWPHRVDWEVLCECARAVVGVHDFTAFTPTETEHVRFERCVLGAEWRAGSGGAGCAGGLPEVLEFWIEADAFMRHMNRVLVGTMLEVAGGRRSVSEFLELLDGRPRSQAGPTAPACGLYLVGVGYEGKRVLPQN